MLWAYLEPINPIYPRGILSKTLYTIGRHPTECDIILDSKELRQHEYFIHLSSKHFQIESNDQGRTIFFRDVSRNGCYVDGELVHHSKILLQNAEHVMSVVLPIDRFQRIHSSLRRLDPWH